MNDIVIAEAVRSAVGRGHKGSLATKRPDELAADVIRGLLARVPQLKGSQIDDVVLGCAMPEGEQGLNVARLITLLADLPKEVGAQTINRFCSSGLQAIATAAGQIAIGSADVVIAGGVESMSTVPMTGFHLSASPELNDKLPAANTPMGLTAENVAKQFGITRQMQDEFAYKSQQKAKAALDKGVFKDEIVPVRAVSYKDGQRVYTDFTVDELPRPETTLEGLGKLPPAFAQGGSVTAGKLVADLRRRGRRGGHERRQGQGARHQGPGATSAATSPSASTPRSWASARSPRCRSCSPSTTSRSATSTCSSSTRRSRRSRCTASASSASPTTGSTSTAARSRSAIRSAAPGPSSRRRRSTSCAAAAGATPSSPCASAAGRAPRGLFEAIK
jgi:acetyl-CoA acetyltransferase